VEIAESPFVETPPAQRLPPQPVGTVLDQDGNYEQDNGANQQKREQPFLLPKPCHGHDGADQESADADKGAVAIRVPVRQRSALRRPARVLDARARWRRAWGKGLWSLHAVASLEEKRYYLS